MSDESRPDDQTPRPRYGEYAPGQPSPQQPAPAASEQPAWAPPPQYPGSAPSAAEPTSTPETTRRPRKTVDIVITVVLLVLGLGGTLLGCLYGAVIADPSALNEGLRAQGRPEFRGSAGIAPALIIGSHVVLYLLAVGLSILRIVRRRLAFWIPLVAGVVAAIVFWACIVTVFTSDPAFLEQFQQSR